MLLTLFGTPKPSVGHIGTIQYNALRSWTLLGDDCEVLLLGDDEGTAEIARELGIQHVPGVPTSDAGVPLLDGLLSMARERGRGRILCYANSDIVFTRKLPAAVAAVANERRRFLLTGRRTTLDVTARLEFGPGWSAALSARAAREGTLDSPGALDYFAFSRDVLRDVPPFAIGRTQWDRWLLYGARRDGAQLIDATARVLAVHQAHDYSTASEDVWTGTDARKNRELTGGPEHLFTLADATHELTPTRLRPSLRPERLARRALTWPMLSRGWGLPVRLAHELDYRTRWRKLGRSG